jgi:hypothetical protein
MMDRHRGRRVSNEREIEAQGGTEQRRRRSIGNLEQGGPISDHKFKHLSSGLVLGWHATADRHGILTTSLLLLLEILVVGHLLLLLVGHVARVDTRAHIPLGCVDVVVSHIFWGLGGNIGGVDTIFTGSWVGSVEACLSSMLITG